MCVPIAFDYIGQVGQGVSLADFSARSQNALAQMVAGAQDLVLASTGIKTMRLHVMVCANHSYGTRSLNNLCRDLISGRDTST